MNQDTDSNFSKELLRKGLHLAALLIPAGMLNADKSIVLPVLGVAMAVALSLDLVRARFSRVARMTARLFGKLMRPEELSPSQTRISINGATWTLVSAFLLLWLFPVHIAAFAMTVFLLGDAASGLTGHKFGTTSWRISRCTVEGSAAFLIASSWAAFFMPGIESWIGILAILAGCAAEILPGPFNDNLQVPLLTALAVIFLEWIITFDFFF